MQRLRERIAELARVTGRSSTCGWMDDASCYLLYGLVKHVKPDVVLQSGHLWGKSALVVLEALTDDALLDNWDSGGDHRYSAFVGNRRKRIGEAWLLSADPHPLGVHNWQAGVDLLREWYGERFRFKHESSPAAFQTMPRADGAVILAIVDGNHEPHGCGRDISEYARIGCDLIIVDDTTWIPALAKVARECAAELGYDVLELPYGGGWTLLGRRA